jgi:hypothetical protein
MFSRTISKVALGVCSAFAAASVGAATISWNFITSTENALSNGTYGNSRYLSSGGVTATASAWSNTANQTVGGVTTADVVIDSAYLGVYPPSGGLGATNRDGTTDTSSCTSGSGDRCEGTPGNTIPPEHAIDNNQRFDSVRISFGTTAINLKEILVGYVSGDADITVLASNNAALSGRTYGGTTGLLAAGWTLIGNYADLTAGVAKSIANTTFATDWLIIAYNPIFGTGNYLTGGDDNFKLKLVTGDTRQQVPEPGTLLLLGAALAGIWSRRRVARL